MQPAAGSAQRDSGGAPWGLAVAAFFGFVTSLFSPWWVVDVTSDGARLAHDLFFAFRPEPPVTTTWAPHVTGALVVLAALVLFVRVAARSWWYEPPKWRRDLWVVCGLGVAALASALFWPDTLPSFWGGRDLTNTTTGQTFTDRASPGMGWWLAALCAASCGGAAWLARRDASGK